MTSRSACIAITALSLLSWGESTLLQHRRGACTQKLFTEKLASMDAEHRREMCGFRNKPNALFSKVHDECHNGDLTTDFIKKTLSKLDCAKSIAAGKKCAVQLMSSSECMEFHTCSNGKCALAPLDKYLADPKRKHAFCQHQLDDDAGWWVCDYYQYEQSFVAGIFSSAVSCANAPSFPWADLDPYHQIRSILEATLDCAEIRGCSTRLEQRWNEFSPSVPTAQIRQTLHAVGCKATVELEGPCFGSDECKAPNTECAGVDILGPAGVCRSTAEPASLTGLVTQYSEVTSVAQACASIVTHFAKNELGQGGEGTPANEAAALRKELVAHCADYLTSRGHQCVVSEECADKHQCAELRGRNQCQRTCATNDDCISTNLKCNEETHLCNVRPVMMRQAGQFSGLSLADDLEGDEANLQSNLDLEEEAPKLDLARPSLRHTVDPSGAVDSSETQ